LCSFLKYSSNICSKKFVTDPFFGFHSAFLLHCLGLLPGNGRSIERFWSGGF
jgi:hypothetical protein